MSDNPQDTATKEVDIKTCAKCGKSGSDFRRCSRCKEARYCGVECQKTHWPTHKADCKPASEKPKPADEDTVVGFVECETYEECRVYLVKNPQIITKEISDEMFQKGFLCLKTHPKEIGTRFIRNAQILQYLLDIRKASGGQQDITLFFTRILDPTNPEYRNNFNVEYKTLVKRILKRIKEKEKEAKKAGKVDDTSSTTTTEETSK